MRIADAYIGANVFLESKEADGSISREPCRIEQVRTSSVVIEILDNGKRRVIECGLHGVLPRLVTSKRLSHEKNERIYMNARKKFLAKMNQRPVNPFA